MTGWLITCSEPGCLWAWRCRSDDEALAVFVAHLRTDHEAVAS